MSKGSSPIDKIGSILSAVPPADVTLRIRISPEEACRRVLKRGIDEESIADLIALSSALDEIQADSDWVEIDASGTPDEVLSSAKAEVCAKLATFKFARWTGD
jgi:thymidylate kinase